MIAGHEAGGAGTDAMALRCLDRSLDDRGMPAKIEIIVARKRQQTAAAALGNTTPGNRAGLCNAMRGNSSIDAVRLKI